ncbi:MULTISPECIES: curli assembly protein CsgF [unclassified Shewanella]|uniref:curli assembly protein CsgF n=1 Tax=unclassified Shewanella TaxID=196818 RepID=UPI000C838DF3|nr:MULTISPECIES: curli assembly protein CsgF [unclassified Shewanella]MDO6618187.1 curli assembly protein CsgF [Shewanella sp. 6_MG-2023]MDO6638459.1 curli assembly protein CsgF [Shewanella sp. 5_MG-2023]MDO6677365.1 curli assembly protein CsgF [Shewanella sp. 4_MG-2023]MDO6774282.1 curli assembly protein CsgF [Shewanella sp. 3_MG-2023]PMG29278.1 curli production assembly protein CsgF [Shewanella sp. 10N.286.52.C2]
MKKITFTSILLILSVDCFATQLIYQPVNPAFGGSYLNGSYLLANAAAQNDHESSGGSGYVAPTALERLSSSLQSRLMSQLFNDAANGGEGYLLTDDFEINVVNEDGSLIVHITDVLTGETTIIEVGGIVDDSVGG